MHNGITAKDGRIVNGHLRYLAVRRLGYSASMAGMQAGKLYAIKMENRETKIKLEELAKENKPIGSYIFKQYTERY